MSNANPAEYAALLTAFREGLSIGVFTKADVTQWADGFILRDEEPDIFFIELALSHDEQEALVLLIDATFRWPAEVNLRPLFGAIYKRVLTSEITILEAANCLNHFSWDDKLLTEAESCFVDFLPYHADYLDISDEATPRQVEQETVRFLSLYEHYNVENFARWAALDQEINARLREMPQPGIATSVKPPWWQFWKDYK